MLREVLDQVLERLVRHLCLVGPGGVTKNTRQPLRICSLDGPEGIEQCTAYIAGGGPHIRPVSILRDSEAIVSGGAGIVLVLGLGQCIPVLLIPNIREPLEEPFFI